MTILAILYIFEYSKQREAAGFLEQNIGCEEASWASGLFGAYFFMCKKSVLLADKDPLFVSELSSILQKNGYSVIGTAGDGIDAVSLCSEKKPDLAFLGENLPYMDGFCASSCLRSKGYSGMLFITTEQYRDSISELVKSHGADGSVVKPISEKFLIPWLSTKLVRVRDISDLQEEKERLLKTLETNRVIEEADGIIAAASGVSIQEADHILEEKAKAGKLSKTELARILTSSDKK